MKNRYYIPALLTLSLALIPSAAVRAEDEPAPGVARVSLIHGDVSTERGDSGDRAATTVNAPLVRGDKISTGGRSRGEVELDHANILRLDQRTEVQLADLTRTRIQLQVARGTINYTVLKGTEADVEIDTPNVSVHPLGPGSYRVQVNSQDETQVIVREGEAEVTTPEGSVTVEKKKQITIQGADSPQYQIAKAPRRDEWDEWNRDRDRAIEDAESWGHTNRYYTGSHDLDRYGHWRNVPDYGDVWVPDSGPDFVPYRDGRWVWEPYYGWTWVSYEPWGWAPYHYGRWFLWGSSWAWWPGPIFPAFRPFWSPAFVTFFGFGRHFGFGFGFGSIGWLPIGPWDPFFPWWGFGGGFNVVNITNIINITNITNIKNVTNVPVVPPLVKPGTGPAGSNISAAANNPNVRKGITNVPAGDFGKGRVPTHPTPVTAAMVKQGQAVTGNLPVVPTRQSLRAVDRPAGAAAAARTNQPQHFFSKAPPPAGPRPFTEQAAEVQRMVENHGKTGNPAVAANVARPVGRSISAGSAGPAGAARSFGGAAPRAAARATRAGQETKPASAPQAETIPARGEAPASGWHRFGEGNPQSPRPVTGSAVSRQTPAARPAETIRPQSPAPSDRSNDRSNWQKFSSSPKPGSVSRVTSAPTAARPAPSAPATREAFAPRTFTTGPAPASSGEGSGGWQRFSHSGGRPAPSSSGAAPAEGRSSFSAPRGESAPSGWSHFTPRSDGAVTRRTYDRPPLDLQRPIVSERPRSYEGSGSGGWSGRSAPSTPASRSFESGGTGGWTAPSGGWHGSAAPAPAPRSSGGGGGSRGWSAPSGGSGGGGGFHGGSSGGHSSSAPSGSSSHRH